LCEKIGCDVKNDYLQIANNSSTLNSVADNTANTIAQPFGFTPTSTSFGYDANGNMTSGNGHTMAYNPIDLPTKVSGANGDIFFNYTFSGQRVAKNKNNQTRV